MHYSVPRSLLLRWTKREVVTVAAQVLFRMEERAILAPDLSLVVLCLGFLDSRDVTRLNHTSRRGGRDSGQHDMIDLTQPAREFFIRAEGRAYSFIIQNTPGTNSFTKEGRGDFSRLRSFRL